MGANLARRSVWHLHAVAQSCRAVVLVVRASCRVPDGYYLWRVNHVRLEKKLEIARLVRNEWESAERGKGILYDLECLTQARL